MISHQHKHYKALLSERGLGGDTVVFWCSVMLQCSVKLWCLGNTKFHLDVIWYQWYYICTSPTQLSSWYYMNAKPVAWQHWEDFQNYGNSVEPSSERMLSSLIFSRIIYWNCRRGLAINCKMLLFLDNHSLIMFRVAFKDEVNLRELQPTKL